METNFDLAIVGCGNMGAALIAGYAARKPMDRILVIDPDLARCRSLLPDDANIVFVNNVDALKDKRSALVILAVKPQSFGSLLPALRDTTVSVGLVLSIAAGVGAGSIRKVLPDARIVRCMPNTPALKGAGASVIWCSDDVTEHERLLCRSVFEAVGTVDCVDGEEQIDLVTAISGSGPAYVFAFTEALMRAGEAIGLSAELSRRLACTTVTGAAAMMAGPASDPGSLKAAVRSPAGTTDAALRVFEGDNALELLVQSAVVEAHARAVELRAESNG